MVSKYTAQEASANVLTTALNSLANGANKITSTAISNDDAAERDLFGTFRLSLATQSTRDANAYVEMYFLPGEDGTFAYGGDSLDPAPEHLVHIFNFDEATTAREQVSGLINFPSGDFHVLLINETGQAFAASGNTLTYQRLDGGYADV
jgi:hypothetical protein